MGENLHKRSTLNSSVYICALIVIAVGVLLFWRGPAALAQSSVINATLCDTRGPDIAVIEPINGSTVSTGSVQLRATSTRTTQVDIYINGIYSHTVALAYDDMLNTPLALRSGENAIEIRAHFSCNQTSAVFELTVYFDPEAQGSAVDQGGDIDSSGAAHRQAVLGLPPDLDIAPLDRALERLTGVYIESPDYVKLAFSWTALCVSFVAAAAFARPRYISNLLLGAFKGRKLHHRIDVVIRIIAGIAFLLVAVLLSH